MKFNHVVVVYKGITKLRSATDEQGLVRLKKDSPKLYKESLAQQDKHLGAINQTIAVLEKFEIDYEVIHRENLEQHLKKLSRKTDLIIAIGGDGTVLAAAHVADSIPILAINSLPKTSRGYFCVTTAQDFENLFLKIIKGKKKTKSLPLLKITINDQEVPTKALNDILFTSESPAETVQYTLQVGKNKERQRGSGIWLAAGPGSTAGIKSAGGKVQNITSEKIQFLARELCETPELSYKLRQGFIAKNQVLKIISESDLGRIYIDGKSATHHLSRGATLSIEIAKQKLQIYL
ncbi:MAG: NAD(+)/NADH kinase [Pseudomonadota bacterium]